MYLIKRGSMYYIEYADNSSNKPKRVSTGKKRKSEAAKIMEQFARSLRTSKDQVGEDETRRRGERQ